MLADQIKRKEIPKTKRKNHYLVRAHRFALRRNAQCFIGPLLTIHRISVLVTDIELQFHR